MKLSIAAVAKLARKQFKVKNVELDRYTNGSLVPLGSDGRHPLANAPIVLALNETLIIFLIPDQRDPKVLRRIDVALP
jgi:hypothetical protein